MFWGNYRWEGGLGGSRKGVAPRERGGSPPVNVYIQNDFVCITDINILYLNFVRKLQQ